MRHLTRMTLGKWLLKVSKIYSSKLKILLSRNLRISIRRPLLELTISIVREEKNCKFC